LLINNERGCDLKQLGIWIVDVFYFCLDFLLLLFLDWFGLSTVFELPPALAGEENEYHFVGFSQNYVLS